MHTDPNGNWSVTTTGAAPAVAVHVFGDGVTSTPPSTHVNVPENTSPVVNPPGSPTTVFATVNPPGQLDQRVRDRDPDTRTVAFVTVTGFGGVITAGSHT